MPKITTNTDVVCTRNTTLHNLRHSGVHVTSNYNMSSVSPPYTIIYCNASGGLFTVTLPAPNASGIPNRKFIIMDEGGFGNIVINPGANKTINGQATYTIDAAYGSFSLYSNGTAWFSAV